VEGSWKRLHNKELHHFYSSPNIIRVVKLRRMQWARQVACMRNKKCIQILAKKPEGKVPLRTQKHR
jgi:hypothetical protein